MKKNDAVRKADELVADRLDKFGRMIGLEAMTRVMRRTPIDTGHARGNWNASKDDPDFSVVDGRREQEALAAARVEINAWQMSKGRSMHIANGVPYIERLEDGWSKQAPNGMARLTVQELRPLADEIAIRLNRG